MRLWLGAVFATLNPMLTAVRPAQDLYDGGLPITEVFGLPVHPLVVHGAVVLLPLAAIGLILMSASAKHSKRYGGLVVVVALVAWLFSILAMLSGRDLRAAQGRPADLDHFVWGGWLPWAGLALFGVTALLWLADRKASARSGLGVVVSLVGFVVAAGTLAATIYVGHLGAELTWGSR
jgi:hypothetical protein